MKDKKTYCVEKCCGMVPTPMCRINLLNTICMKCGRVREYDLSLVPLGEFVQEKKKL